MALSSQRASASLPSAPRWKYDMFLSFSGKDTRRGIVASLYHELLDRKFKPFMDSKELEAGNEISSNLLTAVQESRSAIIFLSPNYASSTWCLEELAHIVQCWEAKNTIVLPIFYDVDPSDVRHQKRTFAEAFTRHEQRIRQDDDNDKVKRWRAALQKVANLSGLESNKFESDRELVHHILELVRIKLTRQSIDRIPEPASRWKHDVFLSFTGEDPQEGLVSHLYHQLQNRRGITPFKDDGELKKWTDISETLITAIEKSRLAIVVLTPNFASSTWCLDVLTKIFQCMKDKNRILPIFYNVDPSDVRNQKGSFDVAFAKHEKRLSQGSEKEKVTHWRLGLKKVSNLTGWDSKNYKSETKLAEHILEIVCSKVQTFEVDKFTGHFESFEPTRQAIDQVMNMLKNDRVTIIGVYGMGGVGKTTMVKHIGAQAQKYGLFDHVVMAVVSQSPDCRKIQGKFADMLGMKLPEETESARAQRLQERIMTGNRILIILDDIWNKIDLSSIGIPGYNELQRCNSKVILTTRRLMVCHSMESHVNIPLSFLSKEDSWNLFVKEARNSFTSTKFYDVAREVARECAGLPVTLIAVARALRDKDLDEWKEAARQLRSASFPVLEDELDAFRCIKLSYDYLSSYDAKSCFLLCCLFPEDYDIRIEDLLRYGIGIGLFEDSNMQIARARAHSVVKSLKASGLLLDTEKDECVRMHDFMRDAGIYIACSKVGHGLLVRAGWELRELPHLSAHQGFSAISLMRNRLRRLPQELVCPNLLTLLLQSNEIAEIAETFFQSLTALRVLDLSFTSISSPPASFSLLTNLQTLCLDYCDQLIDISILGNLKKLEVLSMKEFPLEELPKEIGNLTNLRMLDLSGSYNISVFPLKLMSRLNKLEELYMQCNFGDGESKVAIKEEETSGSCDEKTYLNILELRISDAECLPKYVEVNPNWVNFDICISKYLSARASTLEHDILHHHSKDLTLDITMSSLPDWFIKAVTEKTEKLEYVECKGLNNILVEYDLGRLAELKYLAITGRHENLEELMNTKTCVQKEPVFESLEELHLCEVDCLKKLCVGKLLPGSLCNLKNLVITSCVKLTSLFRSDIAQNLLNLEDLLITQCTKLNRVIEAGEPMIHKKIVFPRLKNVLLFRLPLLTWFYTGSATIECPSLEHLHVQDCPQFSTSTSDFHSWNQVQVNDLRHLRMSNRFDSALDEEDETGLLVNTLRNKTESLSGMHTEEMVESSSLKQLHVQDCPQFSTSTSDFHSCNQVQVNDLRHLRMSNMFDSAVDEEDETGLVDTLKNKTESLSGEHTEEMVESMSSSRDEEMVESQRDESRRVEVLREIQSQNDESRRVEVLREIQSQRDELEAKFLKDIAAIEAKYQQVVSCCVVPPLMAENMESIMALPSLKMAEDMEQTSSLNGGSKQTSFDLKPKSSSIFHRLTNIVKKKK